MSRAWSSKEPAGTGLFDSSNTELLATKQGSHSTTHDHRRPGAYLETNQVGGKERGSPRGTSTPGTKQSDHVDDIAPQAVRSSHASISCCRLECAEVSGKLAVVIAIKYIVTSLRGPTVTSCLGDTLVVWPGPGTGILLALVCGGATQFPGARLSSVTMSAFQCSRTASMLELVKFKLVPNNRLVSKKPRCDRHCILLHAGSTQKLRLLVRGSPLR